MTLTCETCARTYPAPHRYDCREAIETGAERDPRPESGRRPRRLVKQARKSPPGPQGGWCWWLELHCGHTVSRRKRGHWADQFVTGAQPGVIVLPPPTWVRCEYCPAGAKDDPKECFTRDG